MRSELKRLQRELGITTIYVTHDQIESIQMSDRIAVMNGGHILQIGNPDEIYERPASRFVADFMGTSNLIAGVLRKSVNGPTAAFVDSAVGPLQCSVSCAFSEGARVLVSVRPENIKFAPEKAATDPNVIRGRIKERNAWQGVADYCIEVGGVELRVRAAVSASALTDSEVVQLELIPDKCVVLSTDEGDRSHESAAAL
jgi:ABC-type Fe3+/spermidine/putrescine transport system ATPase subunit